MYTAHDANFVGRGDGVGKVYVLKGGLAGNTLCRDSTGGRKRTDRYYLLVESKREGRALASSYPDYGVSLLN